MKFFPIVFLLSCLAITGCSRTPIDTNDEKWSQHIPPREYFTHHYENDLDNRAAMSEESYLRWIHRFYFGWQLHKQGWLQASDELVQTLKTGEERKKARETALLIGKRVSAEWAKHKRHRVINTRHLIIWGNALNESIVQKEQQKILDKILNDVNTLLKKKIRPQDIAANRYYEYESFGENF